MKERVVGQGRTEEEPPRRGRRPRPSFASPRPANMTVVPRKAGAETCTCASGTQAPTRCVRPPASCRWRHDADDLIRMSW